MADQDRVRSAKTYHTTLYQEILPLQTQREVTAKLYGKSEDEVHQMIARLTYRIGDLESTVSLLRTHNETLEFIVKERDDQIANLKDLIESTTQPKQPSIERLEPPREATPERVNRPVDYPDLVEPVRVDTPPQRPLSEPDVASIRGLSTSPSVVAPATEPTVVYQKAAKKLLADPEKFDGDLDWFEIWVSRMRNKLQVDGGCFPTNRSKRDYVYSRLEDGVYRPFIHQYNLTYEEVMEELEDSYGIADKEGYAQSKYDALKQNDMPLHEFILEFKRLSLELSLSDQQKMRGLKAKIAGKHYYLVSAAYDKSFKEVIRQLQYVAESDLHRSASRQKTPTGAKKSSRRNDRLPERSSNQESNKSTTINQDTSSTRLTSAKRDYRRENRLCYRCGKPGHMAPECPKSAEETKAAKSTSTVAQTEQTKGQESENGQA